jgi:hypothetical protein
VAAGADSAVLKRVGERRRLPNTMSDLPELE